MAIPRILKHELAGVPETVAEEDGVIYIRVRYLNAKREVRVHLYGPLSKGGAAAFSTDLAAAAEQPEAIPPCAASMGCLCAGHARGDSAAEPCDTSEG